MATNDIISFYDLVKKHGMVQRGISYSKGVILMSGRKDAPYVDKEIDGQIVYEGEDVFGARNKKKIDQELSKGNKALYDAVKDYIEGKRGAAPLHVYEKIGQGKWIDRGEFKLVGVRKVFDGKRNVYRFLLSAGHEKTEKVARKKKSREHIPSEVQIKVWKRDNGKCVLCGSTENLHFDHIIPVSKGGSNSVDNIQILCSKCNLKKSDKIGGKMRR